MTQSVLIHFRTLCQQNGDRRNDENTVNLAEKVAVSRITLHIVMLLWANVQIYIPSTNIHNLHVHTHIRQSGLKIGVGPGLKTEDVIDLDFKTEVLGTKNTAAGGT